MSINIGKMDKLYITKGRTLIDITNTGVVASSSSKERNQYRNWETTKQVLGLRTQLILLTPPTIQTIDVSELSFGKYFTGNQKVWEFKFGVEFDAIFADGSNPFGTLEKDFVNVPIIVGLDETVKINTPTFVVDGDERNIFFETFDI